MGMKVLKIQEGQFDNLRIGFKPNVPNGKFAKIFDDFEQAVEFVKNKLKPVENVVIT